MKFFLKGVIDPKKVTRVALENAASVAGMILTTECALVDIKDIEGLGFSEFVEPLKNPYNNKKYAESFMDENNAVIRWVNTLKDLK